MSRADTLVSRLVAALEDPATLGLPADQHERMCRANQQAIRRVADLGGFQPAVTSDGRPYLRLAKGWSLK